MNIPNIMENVTFPDSRALLQQCVTMVCGQVPELNWDKCMENVILTFIGLTRTWWCPVYTVSDFMSNSYFSEQSSKISLPGYNDLGNIDHIIKTNPFEIQNCTSYIGLKMTRFLTMSKNNLNKDAESGIAKWAALYFTLGWNMLPYHLTLQLLKYSSLLFCFYIHI